MTQLPQLPPAAPPVTAPAIPGRPYRLPTWSVDALRELIDVLVHVSEGVFANPMDLGDRLRESARSLETVLPMDQMNEAELLDALLMQSYALYKATRELSRITGRPQAELNIGFQFAAWDQAQALGAPVNRDTLNGALYMLRQVQRQPY